jgi:hypothetical protein
VSSVMRANKLQMASPGIRKLRDCFKVDGSSSGFWSGALQRYRDQLAAAVVGPREPMSNDVSSWWGFGTLRSITRRQLATPRERPQLAAITPAAIRSPPLQLMVPLARASHPPSCAAPAH